MSVGVFDYITGLGIFRRDRYPVELKVLAIVNYIFLSSYRRTAKALSVLKKSARLGEQVQRELEDQHGVERAENHSSG